MLSLKKSALSKLTLLRNTRTFTSSALVRQTQGSVNGSASRSADGKYHIIDHEYDCVVIGAGGTALERPLVLPRRATRLLVYPSFSPPDPTLLLLRVVSMPLWEICTRITGNGICTIL